MPTSRITAIYRAAFAQPKVKLGRQAEALSGAELYVLPNPSGLNAHAQLSDLAEVFRVVTLAAGVPVGQRPW